MATKKKAAPETTPERTFVVAFNPGNPPVIVHAAESPELAKAWRDGFNYAQGNREEKYRMNDESVALLLGESAGKHPEAYEVTV